MLQAPEILIALLGHYYSLSNKRLKKKFIKKSQDKITDIAVRITTLHISLCHSVTRMGTSVFLELIFLGRRGELQDLAVESFNCLSFVWGMKDSESEQC